MFAFHHVHFTYPGQQAPALSDLNLQIQRGTFTALMGACASGKSTLAGLSKALLLPAAGEVLIAGLNTLSTDNRAEIRRMVGLVQQNPDDQIVATTVEEDVAFGPANLGLPGGEIRHRVEEALALTGLLNLRTQPVHHLSGGQKQRLVLAGVLAMRPQAIILDEVTAMLDPAGRAEVMTAVRHCRQAYDLSVLWITHLPDETLLADRLVVLRQGGVVLDGMPRDILSRQDLREYGLISARREPSQPLEKPDLRVVPRTSGRQPVLTLEQVSYTYRDSEFALKNIDLSVAAGETLLLIGASGAGKSTLLQHCNGLLRPTSGRVLLQGTDIRAQGRKGKTSRALRFQVGMVFQFPEQQLFAATLREDIAFGPRNMGLSPAEVAERVAEACGFTGLSQEILTRSPQSLSAGEKRCAALAGVLAMRPRVLVLDEPTAGLDPLTGRRLVQNLRAYQREHKAALLVATHHYAEFTDWADRGALLRDGQIVLQGRLADVLADAGFPGRPSSSSAQSFNEAGA